MVKSNPEKEEKIIKVEKAIESSKESVKNNIFSEELNKKFKDLEIAIEAEEEKLNNLYGIEKELSDITVVVNAGKDCINEIENNKLLKTEEYNKKINELEIEYAQKTKKLQEDYEQMAKDLKLKRDREIEEYEYKTKRDREISNNEWNDKKIERESKLAKAEEETMKLLEEANEKVQYIKQLEEKVEKIPELLQKEYERGKKDATTELERENKFNTELLKKDYTNKIERQNDKIESLKDEIDNVNKMNVILQEKMDKAYAELKELATKTVESAGGVKIIGNNNSNEN